MIEACDLGDALKTLAIPGDVPVIVHSSMSAFGYIQGGSGSLLKVLTDNFNTIVMPGFTYKTMITPRCGPPENGIDYTKDQSSNRLAEFFHPQMPVDRLMGTLSETLRRHPRANRSSHPILSFVGIGAEEILASQTINSPLQPIKCLMDQSGWVLLLGVKHDVNTGIHYAEVLSGRKQFIRWALTLDGVVECPGFPGCSDGFVEIERYVESISHVVMVGGGIIQALPIDKLVAVSRQILDRNPLALLCTHPYCARCEAVRNSVAGMG